MQCAPPSFWWNCSKTTPLACNRLGRAASSALRVFNALCERPIDDAQRSLPRTGLSFPTATKGIDRLMNLGIVRELTGGRRNRVFSYDRYLAILNEGTEPL